MSNIPIAGSRATIRRATHADRAPVQRIAADAMLALGLIPDFDGLDLALGRFGDAHAGTFAEVVAERGSDVLGSLVLIGPQNGVFKLSGFYVDAGARGQGIGRSLLQWAIDAATSAGGRTIELETWSHMNAAVHLYQSLGWRPVAKLDPDSGAEWRYVLDLASRA